MKKFITAAAFLAASTALASAATLIAQWDDFSDLVSDYGTTTLTVDVGSTASSVSGTTLSVNNSAASTDYANRVHVDLSSVSISAANGGFTLVLDISGFSNAANNLIADMVGGCSASGDSVDGAYGIGRGNYQAAYWRINNAGTFNTEEQSGNVATSANPGTLVFTCTSEGLLCFYVGGTLANTLSASSFDADALFTRLTLGGYGDHTTSGANSTFSLSKMALYSGVLSTDDIASGNVYYSIPEPSAFGLLAGAGALALVAARRRRRAK